MFLGHSVVVVSSSARLATGLMRAFHILQWRRWSRLCTETARKKAVGHKRTKHNLLTCCLATRTQDADCQEERDDVSVTSLDDHVRNLLRLVIC